MPLKRAESSDGSLQAAPPRKKPAFSTAAILQSVTGIVPPGTEAEMRHEKSVRERLPGHFPPDVVRQWEEWAEETPNTLAEVPEQQRLRQCLMPCKCLAPGVKAMVKPREQKELVTYANPGGRKLDKEDREREAARVKPLVEGEVSVGQSVAIRRAVESHVTPGYGTPFYVGDVIEVELEDAAPGTSTNAAGASGNNLELHIKHVIQNSDLSVLSCKALRAQVEARMGLEPGALYSRKEEFKQMVERELGPPANTPRAPLHAPPRRRIKRVHVHWRMPVSQNKFCNDILKPWRKACKQHHQWTLTCDKRNACNGGGGCTDARLTYWADANEIFEVGLKLKSSEAIDRRSKERLAQHDGLWFKLLGLDTSKVAKKRIKSKR
jgi:hypothetical protein